MSRIHSVLRLARPLSAVLASLACGALRAEVLGTDLVRRLAESARTNHPGLLALEHRADASRLGAESSRRWSDPTFRIGGTTTGSRGPSTREEGDVAFGVTQPLPVMGKESARRQVAEEEARTAVVRIDTRWTELRRDLAVRLGGAALAERVVGLRGEDARWLGLLGKDLEALQSARAVPAAAVLRVARERLEAELAVTNGLAVLRDARVAVHRLLSRPVDGPSESLTLPDPIPEIRFAPGLLSVALAAEPRLRLARREAREAAARVVRTRRAARPDLSLGLDSRQYSGDGGLREATATLNLSVPWFNRANYRREIRRDQSLEEAARLEVRDLEAEVSAEVHHWVSAINNAGREHRLLREQILPRLATSLEVVRAQWEGGQADLRDVLELHRQRVDAEIRLARAAADQWIAIGELLLCCGLDDLDAFLAVAAPVPASASVPETPSSPSRP